MPMTNPKRLNQLNVIGGSGPFQAWGPKRLWRNQIFCCMCELYLLIITCFKSTSYGMLGANRV